MTRQVVKMNGNRDHLNMLIRISNGPQKVLLQELSIYIDTLSDEEYHDLTVGIRNGSITDLYPINERHTEIDK